MWQFLLVRQMRVHANGSFSSWFEVISGVPQRSVVEPLLFLIFINNLPNWITNTITMFADDTKIWTKIKDIGDSEQLRQYVSEMVEAMVTCLQYGQM